MKKQDTYTVIEGDRTALTVTVYEKELKLTLEDKENFFIIKKEKLPDLVDILIAIQNR